MEISYEELTRFNTYITSQLRNYGFEVSFNEKYGYIKSVKKYNISCVPGISTCDKGEDSYWYILLISGNNSKKDLGYYAVRYPKEVITIKKYSLGNNISVNLDNYKRVINRFCRDLNDDYDRLKSKKLILKEDINSDFSVGTEVKVHSTGTALDEKTGIIIGINDNIFTVRINFDAKGHKLIQDLTIDNLDILTKEIIENE